MNSSSNFHFLENIYWYSSFDFLQEIKLIFYYLENQAFSKNLKFDEEIIKVWKYFSLFKVDFLQNRVSKKFTVLRSPMGKVGKSNCENLIRKSTGSFQIVGKGDKKLSWNRLQAFERVFSNLIFQLFPWGISDEFFERQNIFH